MTMTETTVIHIKDKAEDDVYIGRGSKWGNPFRIGQDGNRDDVIRLYETYILTSPIFRDLPELVGKRLVCYCAPERCHGDVLAKYANQLIIMDTFEIDPERVPKELGDNYD